MKLFAVVLKLLFVAVLPLIGTCHQTDIKTVYMVLMVPYPDPLGRVSFAATYDDGHDISPAAYLAVEQINNRTDVLQGYKLDLIRSDGGCSIAHRTVYSYAKDIIHRTIPVPGIIGPTCPISGRVFSQLTTDDRVPLVSVPYWVEREYNNTFGILNPGLSYDDAYFQLMVMNNWRRVGVLVSDTVASASVMYHQDYQVVFTAPLYENYIPLESIREQFLRVIIVFSPPELSRRLLCLAYHQNMTFPNYQWIFRIHIDQDYFGITFQYDGEKYHCTNEEIRIALTGNLNIFESLTPIADTTVTYPGLTYPQYLENYHIQIEKYRERFQVASRETYWASPVYDATWALALALNSSLDELEQSNITFTEKDLHRQREITKIIRRHMMYVDFQGITGHIKFGNESQRKKETIDLFQYNSEGASVKVAVFEYGNWVSEPDAVGNFTDYSFKTDHYRLNGGIALLYFVLTVVALMLIIPAQVVNVLYRGHKSIKASSHKLNHIIFIGCYSAILCILIYILSNTLVLSFVAHSIICNLYYILFNLGFTLVFATVLVKTWRLYNLFTTFGKPKIRVLFKDRVMFAIIGLLFLLELAVIVIWVAGAPFKAQEVLTLRIASGSVPMIISEFTCVSDWLLPCLGILLAYKSVLLNLSLVFAVLSRKIYLKHFETKNVILFVYLMFFLCAVGIPVFLIVALMSQSVTLEFLVVITFFLIGVYICLVVLFIPPIIPIIREKFHILRNTPPEQDRSVITLTNQASLSQFPTAVYTKRILNTV